jgi:pimeloyl-ACP methyl ester carboxylesterase
MKAVYLPAHQAFLRYLEIPGADPPLLWLHGWQCTSTGELLEAAVQPVLSGRRSLLIDFLGHGYSDRPDAFGYTIEAHADTIVTLIDSLGLTDCGIVAHSMGGPVAIGVAAARPDVVSLLVLAEGGPDIADPDIAGPDPNETGRLDGQSEADYVATGYPKLLDDLAEDGVADPAGVSAAHLGITRVVDPRAIHREAASMDTTDERALASVLGGLAMPRWYLHGELSDPEPDYERFLADSGIGFRIVPGVGHPMGLQNPAGLAATVADVAAQSWLPAS